MLSIACMQRAFRAFRAYRVYGAYKANRVYRAEQLIDIDVHGNGKCKIPIPPVGLPWEWEPNCLN